METIYITKDKKSIAIEVSDKEYEEQKNKTRGLMRYLDRIEREKQAEFAARKVCPDCHLKCKPDGFCMRCGKDCRDARTSQVRTVTNKDIDFKPITIVIRK